MNSGLQRPWRWSFRFLWDSYYLPINMVSYPIRLEYIKKEGRNKQIERERKRKGGEGNPPPDSDFQTDEAFVYFCLDHFKVISPWKCNTIHPYTTQYPTFCLLSRNFPSVTPLSHSMPVRHFSTCGAESGSRKYHTEPFQKRPVKLEHPSSMYPSNWEDKSS